MKGGEHLYEIFDNIKSKKIVEFFNDGFSGMNVALKILYDYNSPLTAGQIADILEISTARVAVLLGSLEHKGLINKSKSKEDARITMVSLTENGKVMIEKRKEHLFGKLDELLSKLKNKEQKQLFGLLQKLFED